MRLCLRIFVLGSHFKHLQKDCTPSLLRVLHQHCTAVRRADRTQILQRTVAACRHRQEPPRALQRNDGQEAEAKRLPWFLHSCTSVSGNERTQRCCSCVGCARRAARCSPNARAAFRAAQTRLGRHEPCDVGLSSRAGGRLARHRFRGQPTLLCSAVELRARSLAVRLQRMRCPAPCAKCLDGVPCSDARAGPEAAGLSDSGVVFPALLWRRERERPHAGDEAFRRQRRRCHPGLRRRSRCRLRPAR